MKKGLLFLLMAFIALPNVLFSQVYQLPNSGFENWETVSEWATSGLEPEHWNSHIENSGTWASTARAVQVEQSTDSHSGDYSCVIKPRHVVLIWANGLITTGQVQANSFSAENPTNHNRTIREDNRFNAPFHGKPDSVVFWAKYVTNEENRYARMHAYIHGNFDVADPIGGNSGSADYIVGEALDEFNRENQAWRRHAVAFNYNGYPHTDAQYMLITFATNRTPGGTAQASDRLYIDDIQMIYNPRLASISVGGTALPEFNPEVSEYTYPDWLCAGQILPDVSGIKQSVNAADPVIVPATTAHPTATITVTHGDTSKTYRVHFNIFNDTPSISHGSRCGAGTVTLNVENPQEGDVYRWYTNELSATPTHTGNSYTTPSLSATTTYYVSAYRSSIDCESARVPVTATINPNPSQPIIENVTNCGTWNGTLTATIESPYTCYWYTGLTDMEPFTTGSTYTTSFSRDTALYLKTVNTETGCSSSVKTMTVTINPVPNISHAAPSPICANESVQLSVTTDANQVNWYTSTTDQLSVFTGNPYTTPALTTDTAFYAQAVNTTTGCKSNFLPITVTVNPSVIDPIYTINEDCDLTTLTLTKVSGQTYSYSHTPSNETTETVILSFTDNATVSILITNSTTLCTQTLATDIRVKKSFTDTETVTECDSHTWRGTTYTANGTYIDDYLTSDGCDSIYTLVLTINESSVTMLHDTICTGVAYNENGFNLAEYTTPGEYTPDITLTNQAGCDSVVTLQLHVKQSYQTTESQAICASELPYTYHGETFTEAGSRNITLITQNGCDSVIHFTLTVKVTPGVPTVYSAEECEGDPVSLTAFFGTNGSHCNWYASDNGDDLLFSGTAYTPVIDSTTIFYVASVSANGCESSRVPITATIIARPETPVVENNSRCGTGSITLTATPPSADLTCNWYTSATTGTVSASNTTTFTRSISGTTTFYVATVVNGVETNCTSDRIAVIATMNPVPAAPQVTNLAVCEGETKTITPAIGSNANSCNWFLTSSSTEEPFYSGTVFTTEELDENVTYYISSMNDQTNCESATRTSLTITVNYIQHTSFSDSGCGEYRWNGETYTVSGSYEQTFLSSHGCDSTVYLTLTIYPEAVTTIDTTVCGSFVRDGVTYETSQTITDTLTTVYGCDSIMLINLIVNDVYHFTTQVSACDQYVWHGETLTQSGTDYMKEFETESGCDSIEYLHLTIHHSTSSDFSAEACDSYTWNGTTYTESGDYTQVFATTHHCDSVVTLHLTIYPSYHIMYTDYICQGTPYEGYGFTVETPVAGTFNYHRNHTIAHDCDSNITLRLTVNPTYNFATRNVTICEESSYNFYGRILTEAGTYTHTFQTQYGCDSTYSIVLHVEDAFITEINASICEGEVYAENGFNESIAGIYRDTLPSSVGCDSIIILTLLVNSVYDEVIYDSICKGDVYFEYGFHIETAELAGTIMRTQELRSSCQCDSTITLHLTILPTYTETISETICYGESYNGNGFDIPMQVEAGVFTFANPLITENGCDSIVYLELTVLPETGESIDTVVCDVFEWNDSIYTASTTIIQTFAKENACDSTFIIRLTVTPSYNMPIFATICEGNAYTDHGFNIIEPEVGFRTDTLRHTTVLGCDSMTVLHLTVNPVNVESYEETICFGEPFDEYGFNLPAQTVSGVFSHIRTEENEFGCRDTVKLMLTVRPSSEIPAADTTDISICADDLPYVYNDEYTFTEGGYYVIDASTDNGCLYYYTVNLRVNERYEYRVDSTVCQSELPVYFAGVTFYGTTSRTFSFETTQGCDSIIHFSLTVNQVYDNTDIDNVCLEEGDVYHYGNSTFTESGNYPVVFTSVNGCDSTVTLDLTINRIKRSTFNDIACSSYTWNDSIYTTSGIYTQIFTATNGCDSIATLNLTVNHVIINDFYVEHCDFFVWNDSMYTTSGTYEQTFRAVNGCDSTVTMHLTLYESVANTIHDVSCGSYAWNDSLYTASGVYTQGFETINGCDSTVTLHLTIDPPVSIDFFETVCGSYTWNDSTYTQSGEYVQRFSTANACDSVVTLHLTINEIIRTSFTADACVVYTWDNREYTVSGDYSHTYTGSNGCDSIATLHLTIGQPNAFAFRDTICQYASYYENGFTIGTQSRTGTFVYDTTVTNVSGCDSIITLTLVVNPSYNITLTRDACEAYTWQDSTYTQSGQYTRHFTTAAGCDSILMLRLTIYQPIRVDIYDTICQGDSYSYLDFDLPAQNWSGDTAIIHRSPITVCDSITTLHLTVNPAYFIRIVDTTGIGVTYNEFGFFIEDPNAGIQRDTLFLQTAAGCDSTVQLLLFIMTGIDEYENLANISLYPNPASSLVTITADLLINRVDIYNVAGKLIIRREQVQDYRFEQDITHFAPGVYILKIHTAQGVSGRKLIVIEN